MKGLGFGMFIFGLLLLAGCNEGSDDDGYYDKKEYSIYRPILMDTTDFIKSIRFEKARPIANRGKIYADSARLLVIEQDSGIHFFDNSDPISPKAIGFLKVLFCTDFLVKANSLFINHSVDMVTMDINNMNSPIETNRIRNAFGQPTTPDKKLLLKPYDKLPRNSVITGWQKIP
jgi:hypothetical protein